MKSDVSKPGSKASKRKDPEPESTMTHKEIKEYSGRYNISWQQVFQLNAEFWSLITIEQEEKEVKRDMDLADPSHKEDREPQDKRIGIEADGPSISLKIFLDFTTSLADKFKEVNKRLISAFGIDTSNENTRIVWDQFLSLKCFLELFTLGPEELEVLWLKALDPRSIFLVPVCQFQDFLEKLARGSMSEEPTLVSEVFSKEMMTLLKLEGCLTGAQGKECIDMTLLKNRVQEGEISIEIFN
jgi:hypothetical protein